MRTPLVIGLVVAPALTIQRARRQSSEFLELECGPGTNPPEKMLPTPLSSDGNPPATHWLCGAREWTAEQFQRMVDFVAMHEVPVTAHILARGPAVGDAVEAGTIDAWSAELQAQWLAESELKAIEAAKCLPSQ